MKRAIHIFAFAWLGFLATITTYSLLGVSSIERHHLNRALTPGFDAFGRDCAMLTAFAIGQSARVVLPLSILTLLVALTFSMSSLLLPPVGRNSLRTFMDACLALPGFLIALALGVVFSQTRWVFVGGALIVAVPSLVKFFDGQLEALAQKDFIHASRALGANPIQILISHFVPEVLSITISFLPFLFLRLIILESSLSFLGLSAVPEHETWGHLLHQGKDYFLEAPWILWTSGVPLVLTLLSFHLLSREDEG